MKHSARWIAPIVVTLSFHFGLTAAASAQGRSAREVPRSEVPTTTGGRFEVDNSVTLDINPGGRTFIVPEFIYQTRTRITATTPEDGKSQIWTGTSGQTARA